MSDVTAPGRELHARFRALGDMAGMTSAQIIAAVGNPSSVSSMAHGQTLLQWQATGCHMAMLFGPDDKLVKITHQYAKYEEKPNGCLGAIVLAVIVAIAVVIVIANHS
jgi:hypothetical protein